MYFPGPLYGALLSVLICFAFDSYADQRDQRVEDLRKASRLMEDHDLQSAEDLLQPLAAKSPPDGIALNLLGLIRTQQHQLAEAQRLFEQAIAVNPRIIGPRLNLAALLGTTRPFDAMSQLKRVFEIVPNDAHSKMLLEQIARESSLDAARSGDKAKSLEILRYALALLPDDAELLYEFGLAALDGSSLEDSQHAFEKLLHLQPGSAKAHYALARVLLEQNNVQQSEDHIRRYLAAYPGDATAHYGLGYILAAKQKTDEARAEFEKSLALEPNQTESLFGLGEIAAQEGQSQLALQYFGKVLLRDPQHAGALTGVGLLAYRSDNYTEARTDLERAISAAPSYQKAHYYYALTLRKLNLQADSEREFEVAMKLQKPHGAIPSLGSSIR